MADEKLYVERLDVDNYATWSIRMRALLVSKGLWTAVTADTPDTGTDQKAHAMILLHVKDHHLATLAECNSAKIAWERLKATYEAKTNARKLLLRRELTQLKMGATEPLSIYAARSKDIQTQLRSAGDEVKDQEVAMQFLAGLPPAYNMISTVLTTSDRELKIDEMLPKLLHVEQQAQPQRPSEAALFAKPNGGYGRGRGNSSRGNRFGNSSKFGSGSRPYKGNSSSTATERRTCFYCGKAGHIAAECRKKKHDEQQGSSQRPQQHGAIALTADTTPANNSTPTCWVLDTGASRHITGDPSILINTTPLEEDITITFGNGGTGKATAIGEAMLDTPGASFHLTDVLLIPEATANLISVRHATKRGLDFTFGSQGCDISRNATAHL